MANVSIELTGNPVFPWQVSSLCRTLAEATAKAARIEAVDPLAFLPTYGAGIAIADGYPATGGGMATHVDDDAPYPGSLDELRIERSGLSPTADALIELSDEDAPIANLKAGEAIA